MKQEVRNNKKALLQINQFLKQILNNKQNQMKINKSFINPLNLSKVSQTKLLNRNNLKHNLF